MSASRQSLFDHLYVNYNMGPLSEFDPSDAVDYWMNEKRRKAVIPRKSRNQEWFKGVFAEAKERTERKHVELKTF